MIGRLLCKLDRHAPKAFVVVDGRPVCIWCVLRCRRPGCRKVL